MHHADKTLLAAALELARKGLPVFPCKPSNKSPWTEHGFKEATTDADRIRAWWAQHPDALIGMPTGSASGVAVLDLDLKPGRDGLAAVPDHATLSPAQVRTRSGGLHLYFRHEPGLTISSDKIAVGVDMRAEGGYVIVPPSTGYSWIGSDDFTSLPPWPEKYRPAPKAPAEPGDDPTASPERVAQALADIPNLDIGWDEWKVIGLATWRATGGSDAGFDAFYAWSRKSNKYDPDETRRQWDGITQSPPERIGAGTLFHLASEAKKKSQPKAEGLALPTIKHGDPIPPMSWLIRNRVPETGAGLLIGQWGSFKTFTFLDIAGSVMTGRDWTGEEVYRRGGVLMFAPEGSGGLGLRVAALAEHRIEPFGGAPFDLKKMPFEWTTTAPSLIGTGKNDPLPAMIATAAAAEARFQKDYGVPLVLIGIDTVAACAGWKDENDNAEASRVMAVLRDLSLAARCAVMGIAHAGKNAELGARGASALEANSDFILLAMGDKTLNGDVTNTKLALRKMRDGPQGAEFPYVAKEVDMGHDERGNPVTSRIIEWGVGAIHSKPKMDDKAKALDQALTTSLEDYGQTIMLAGANRQAVTRDALREAFRPLWKPGKELLLSAKDQRFRQAFNEALAQHRIGTEELDGKDWVWRIPPM